MPLLVIAGLVALFIVVPLAELYVIIQVGQAIGALPTIGLLVLDSILGSVLLRSQGRVAWRRFNAALAELRPPTREVVDGLLVVFGGALLLTPGFVTDALGMALLIAPTRAVVRRLLMRHVAQRLLVTGGAAAAGRRRRGGGSGGWDVEGSAVEIDPRELRDP